jgi:5-methylcytosine-specific restriction protein A
MPGDPFYTSTRWRALRLGVLRRDRYKCSECGIRCLGKKKDAPRPMVDHVKNRKRRPDLAYDPVNLVTMCIGCHNVKTKEKDYVRKNRVATGVDGHPLDDD